MKRLHCLAVVLTIWALITLTSSRAWGVLGDITVTGNWIETIDASDLIAGAGTDLMDFCESAMDQTLITISNTGGDSDTWRVDVKMTTANWHGDLSCEVKRTGPGTGSGSISGGMGYVDVGTSDVSFFSGAGDRMDVPLRCKCKGWSTQIPPDTYSATFIFTVVDT